MPASGNRTDSVAISTVSYISPDGRMFYSKTMFVGGYGVHLHRSVVRSQLFTNGSKVSENVGQNTTRIIGREVIHHFKPTISPFK